MKNPGGAIFLMAVLGVGITSMATIMVTSRVGGGDPADASSGGINAPAEDAKRQRAIVTLLAYSRAITLMRADSGAYPRDLGELHDRGYLPNNPEADPWGSEYVIESGSFGFSLTSLGSDGAAGPPPPPDWTRGAFDVDLIVTNGALTQAPDATAR